MSPTAATLDSLAPVADESTRSKPGRTRTLWMAPVVVALSTMIALPLAEAVARRTGGTWLSAGGSILQHLTLIVGMAGGALAALDGRLLTVASITTLLPAAWRPRAQWFANAVSTTVTAGLGLAATKFVATEITHARGRVAGLPVWVPELALPLGFAAITWCLARQSSTHWRGRLVTLTIAGATLAMLAAAPADLPGARGIGLALIIAATALGAPIFVALGGAGLVLFWTEQLPISVMAIEHNGLVTKPALPTIPLFTLAGYFMAEGGAARRLVRLFQALFGWARGGTAIATALVCAFFTAFTGGSGVTILALGGVLMPALIASRFSDKNALGLLTGAGSLGILLPPCLPVVLYAIVAKVDMKQMFLGGLLPGVLLIAVTASWGVWAGRGTGGAAQRFDTSEAAAAIWAAKWELALPIVAIVALFSGWATAVEAAAITAAFAFFIEVVIHRDLHLVRDCPRVIAEAGQLIGGIVLILGVALGFTNFLIDAQVPDRLADWAFQHVESRWLFLLGLNVILVLVGGVIEIFAAIVVVVPLLVPVGARLGIDPVHLGVVFLANMELGFLAPPIGLNLLLASSRFRRPLGEVTRASLPMFAVLFAGVLAITYFAPLATFLPRFFSSSP